MPNLFITILLASAAGTPAISALADRPGSNSAQHDARSPDSNHSSAPASSAPPHVRWSQGSPAALAHPRGGSATLDVATPPARVVVVSPPRPAQTISAMLKRSDPARSSRDLAQPSQVECDGSRQPDFGCRELGGRSPFLSAAYQSMHIGDYASSGWLECSCRLE